MTVTGIVSHLSDLHASSRRRPASRWPCWLTTIGCSKPISAMLLASAPMSPWSCRKQEPILIASRGSALKPAAPFAWRRRSVRRYRSRRDERPGSGRMPRGRRNTDSHREKAPVRRWPRDNAKTRPIEERSAGHDASLSKLPSSDAIGVTSARITNPVASQMAERRLVVAIEQSCLSLHPDSRGAKDLANQAATQFVRAHRHARDFRSAIILLRRGLIGDIWKIATCRQAMCIERAVPW
jgi:hypothetical protein